MSVAAYNTETQRVSAQFINSNWVRKLDEGRVKEAQDQGTAFIREKLRQESFARRILTPVLLSDDEIDRDVNTDLPKKIVEKEPESTATFVPFKGSGRRRWFRGPRYEVYFGRTESDRFNKSKFELMTYQNDIRKILADNSVKDMADEEDIKFYETIDAIITATPTQAIDVPGGLNRGGVVSGIQKLSTDRLPIGKMLLTKTLFYDLLRLEATNVGDVVAAQHYKEGVEQQDYLWGFPCVTTIKDDILPSNELWIFAPENFLGNFFLLQDATLYIKQEADMITFWSYAAPGIGIGNTRSVIRVRFT